MNIKNNVLPYMITALLIVLAVGVVIGVYLIR